MKRNYIASLLLVPIVALVLAACGSGSGSSSNYSIATTSAAPNAANSAVLAAAPAKPQFIMFSTVWCPNCQQMRPIVNSLKPQYQARIDFQEINREDRANAAIVNKYHINAQPIFIFLDRNGNLVKEIFGNTDKATLTALLDKIAN